MNLLDALEAGIPSNIDQRKKNQNQKFLVPYLYQSKNGIYDYTFIVDKPLSLIELKVLQEKIKYHGIFNYQILYALQVKLTKKDEDKTIWKQYADLKWSFEKYIPANSKIISFGESIFAICESNDLDGRLVSGEDDEDKKKDKRSIIEGFYDTILWETSFFDPKTKCIVYPVDSWDDLYSSGASLINNFESWFFTKQLLIAKSKQVKTKKISNVQKIKVTPNEFLQMGMTDKKPIALDLETKGTDPFSKKGKIVCVTIAYDGHVGYYLPWDQIDKQLLAEYLKDRPIIGSNIKYDIRWLILHGGIPITYFKVVGDTMILQQTVNELQRRSLKGAAYLYTTLGGYDAPLNKYIKDHPEVANDYSLIPEEILFPYATTDPCVSWQVHNKLLSLVDRLDALLNSNNPYGYSLRWLYYEIKLAVLIPFVSIELEGIYIDKEVLLKQSLIVQNKIADIEKEILEELRINKDSGFNLSSSDDLGKRLKELGWPIKDYNKKGLPNVGEEQLIEWEKQGFTTATKILKYKKQVKLLSTYIGKAEEKSGMYKWMKDDERVHSLYDIFGALSARHRSREPNGQNWVSHGDNSKLVRSFITLPENFIFCTGDFSGLQLRLAAMVSDDQKMRDAFCNIDPEQRDLHIVTAYNTMLKYILNIPSLEEAKHLYADSSSNLFKQIKDFRFKAKSINFGLLFGSSAYTLVVEAIKPNWKEDDLDKYIKSNKLFDSLNAVKEKIKKGKFKFFNFTREEDINIHAKYYAVALDIRTKFFETYKGLADWIEHTREVAKIQGFIVSVYGSIRRLPYLLFSDEDGIVDHGKYHNLLNICLNTGIQTMEAVVVNRSIREMWKEKVEKNLSFRFFGQIHDAIESYASKINDEWRSFVKLFYEKCTQDYPEYKGIPLDVEVNISDYHNKKELWDMGRHIKYSEIDNFVL